jgi:DNA-binding response OmpR family regulator
MDHGTISRYLQREFGAKVVGTSYREGAEGEIQSDPFDLILVNRILDGDGTTGLELIREWKSKPDLANTPVMLVSNYPDAQKSAEALGALPGFGKASLGTSATRSKIAAVLERTRQG